IRRWMYLSDNLYVLADPANITPYCGTHADYLLPSACLNSTVSGLTSRTILNKYVNTEAGDFHGATYFRKFESIDKSNEFIDLVSSEFVNLEFIDATLHSLEDGWNGMSIVNDICTLMNVEDYKKVKPGIGETTRVLLRRVPWKVLINKDISEDNPDIQHILVLCKEKNIPTMRWDLGNYKVCGIIKELSADA
ncbi:MAG: ribosomal L7Ae/L30e/S12e/Gadd45 family protein, partial [Lachnospiraceae bacterium]|nr:ribosomal L7Ae/L30e/S12e/Gadd45 family protein [Lachnospiraceae bacterium]